MKKNKKKCKKICTYQKNVVPLHRQMKKTPISNPKKTKIMYAIKQTKFENGVFNFVQILSFRFKSKLQAKDKAFRLSFSSSSLRQNFCYDVVEL